MTTHAPRRALLPLLAALLLLFAVLCIPFPFSVDYTADVPLCRAGTDGQTGAPTAYFTGQSVYVAVSGTYRASVLFGPRSFSGLFRSDSIPASDGQLYTVRFDRQEGGYGSLSYRNDAGAAQFAGYLRMSRRGRSFLLCLPEWDAAGKAGVWSADTGAFLAYPCDDPAALLPQLLLSSAPSPTFSRAADPILSRPISGIAVPRNPIQAIEDASGSTTYLLFVLGSQETGPTALVRAESGERSGEFTFPFPSTGGFLPAAVLFDTGTAPGLLLDVPVGSGTGVNAHTLFVIVPDEDGGAFAAYSLPDSLIEDLTAALTFQASGDALTFSIAGQTLSVPRDDVLPSGADVALDTPGNLLTFDLSGTAPVLHLGLAVSGAGTNGVSAAWLSARVSFQGGLFTLSDLALHPID